MPIVKMPDGTQVQFPDEMPADQIRSMITSKFPELAPKPGLLDRAKSAMSPASVMNNADAHELAHTKEPITPDSPIQNDLSTTGDRALTISLLQQLPATGATMTDDEAAQASMAKTSQMLKGSTSPRIADQAAVNISPEQALSYAIDASTRAADKAGLGAKKELPELYSLGLGPLGRFAPKRSLADTYGDLSKDFMSGMAGISTAAGQAEKLVGLEKIGQQIVDEGDSAQKYWSSLKSDYGKEAEGKKFLRSGNFSSFGNAVNTIASGNFEMGDAGLATVAGQAVQSGPSMIAMGGVGKLASVGLIKSGAVNWAARLMTKSGVAAPTAIKAAEFAADGVSFGGSEGVFSGLQNAAQTGVQIRNMEFDKLKKSPKFNEYLAQQDQALPEQERMQLARNAVASDAESLIFRNTIVTTGGISALTGGGVFGIMNRGKRSAIGRTVGGLATEGGQELTQSGIEQYWQNKGMQIADPTQQSSEGVAEQALQGGIVGAAMGLAGGGAGSHVTATVTAPTANPLQDQHPMVAAHEAAADVLVKPTVDDAIRAAEESIGTKTNDELLNKLNILAGIEPSTSPAEGGMAATSPSLEQQAAPIQGITGSPSEIVLPDNKTLPAQWEVVDADQIKATLKEGENQPRDRTRAASNIQVQGIANSPNYSLLRDSPVMDFGAPTLSQDGAIVGGNGRFEGVSRAYDQGSATDYRSRMEADAASKGIDPATFKGMNKPVLVRRITQPFDTRALAVASNSGGSLQYSALEQAKIDGERMQGIGDVEVNDTGDVVMTGNNMLNIRRSLSGYTPAEYGSLVDKEGQLSQEGMRRFKNAMLYKAYGDSTVLSRLVESADPDMKSVMGALVRSAGSVASVRADMQAGNKPLEADITPHLLSAVEQMAKIKAQGISVEQHQAQKGLLGKDYSDESAEILSFLQANIRSQKRMEGFIKTYYDVIANEDHLTGSMFETAPLTNKERVSHAIETTKQNAEEAPGPNSQSGETSGKQSEGTEGNASGSAQSRQDTGVDAEAVAKATADFEAAKAEAGAFLRSLGTVANIVPEEHERLFPILVKLFDAAFRMGYYDVKAATRYVRAELSKMGEDIAKRVKFIPVSLMERAAKEAAKNAQNLDEQGLFAHAKEAPVLKIYTNAEVLAREATAKKAEEDSNKEAPAKSVTADQVDMFAQQGSLFNSNRELPKSEQSAIPDTWKLAGNKKEYVDENGFVRGLEMSARERAAEQEFYDAIISDIHGLTEKYQKVVLKPTEGRFVDPDRIKELSDAFTEDPSLAHAVHEPSSYLSKYIFESWVADDITNPAVFTAGGGGSGKTEAMSTAQKVAGINPEGVVFDSTLSSFASATKKINQVLNAGGKSTVVYTNTPIEKAFSFAAGRKRVVPITVLARAHQGASDTIRMLDEHYKDNPNVKIIVINNAGELSEIRQGNIDNVPRYDYNEVLKKLYESAKEKLNNGSITQERFDALINGLPEGVKNGKPQQSGSEQNAQRSVAGVQEGKPEREQERLRKRSDGNSEDSSLQGEVSQGQLGAKNEHQPNSKTGTAKQGAAANGGTAVERDAGGIHTGQGQRDIFSNDFPGTIDSREARAEQSGRAEEGGDNGKRDAVSAGNRPGRAVGIPAGRDIPTKSGLNYGFTDADLDYKGSWIVKAQQNVKAVELVKSLEKEGRQATREEQAVLAKFIGWGASEIRNKIFDPQIDRVRRKVDAYNEAMDWLKNNKKETMSRFDYGSPYYTVSSMLNAAGSPVPYGQAATKAMIEKLADKEAVKWLEMHDKIKEMFTPEEWATAERSTQYAHYTGKEVVSEMWRAADRLGFKGGSILEPGAGIGVFPGLMDHAVSNNSVYTGIEYDALTGAILKQLMPDERILVESFVDTNIPNDFYDVAIGNPPFSGTKILSDPAYKKYAFALHDYFFAKTMDKVKPGGLVMFVTSRYTMDKQGDKARQYLAERADLLGAIRLPETAFKKNAGTEVVTDILFLRKKVHGETFQGEPWMNLKPISVKGGNHQINEYFAAHPEMVLGEGAIDKNSMYAKDQYTVLPNKTVPITELLAKAVDSLPAGVFSASPNTAVQAAQIREIDWNPKAKKEGNYYVSEDGKLMQVENKIGIPATVAKKDEALVKDYINLRDAINQAQYDQLNNGPWEDSLKALQKNYKEFVAKNGNVLANTVVTRTRKTEDEEGSKIEEKYETRRFDTISKLNDDPEFTKLYALENLNEDTGAITEGAFLKGRVLDKLKESRIDTPMDAMLSVLNDTGGVDIPLISKRIGLDESDVVEALGSAVFKQPSGVWTTSDDYLSGNVKKKLADAEAAAKTDRSFERNVKALIEAQPSPVPPSDITASLGMNWIPAKIYEQFLKEVSGARATVTHNEVLGTWKVGLMGGEDTTKFGTLSRDSSSILEHALTGRPVRINTRQEGAKEATFDAGATELANQKLKEMREAFKSWLWNDAGRTDELVKLYNDKFNTTVARSFDGTHLTLPGTTSTAAIWDHVKRGAWRIIQSGNTYLAHAVGAGKTNEMVISAMEQKRLGMINKPMFVVPNHMLQQFAQEWLQLYPAARLMVADETQFARDNRQRFVARASMSDLDGVIITHSAFKLLDIDPEFKQKMLNEEIAQMEAARDNAMEEEGTDDVTKSRNPKVRQIQAAIEQLEEKVKASMQGEGKDKNVRFDEMGVDMLYVDEAHLYRKLNFSTARQVKGISSGGSEYARDLHIKTRWIEERHPGRSLVMASGTPITNTLAEIYSVQRFMKPQVLDEKGLHDFDAWASMFGEESTEIEADAAGKYSNVTRFAKFVNVPELTQMFREFADVLTSDHLAEILGDKRPKVKDGSRKLVITPEVSDYLIYKEELARRLKISREWKPSKDEPNNPDPIIRIIGDGRLAAIDMRFIDNKLPSDANSKLNQLADGVIRVYNETADIQYFDRANKLELHKGGAQMVFSDLGFGEGVTESRGFDARAWFERRLTMAGIPKNQVAFMSDFKKSEEKIKLFKDINSGKIRVVVGSSKNMGTGVNAQQRLIALHHLDTPWFPADLEQREGRIIRQGNKNQIVQIYAYSTKGSYDTVMWQLLARKQGFIDQALSGDSSVRTLDDISEVSQFQMATAMTAGDERAIRLAGLKSDIDKYDRLFRGHEQQRMKIKEQYTSAKYNIGFYERQLPDAEKLAAKVQDLSGDKFSAMAGKKFTSRKEWAQALLAKLKHYSDVGKEGMEKIGEVSGFPVEIVGHINRNESGKVLSYEAKIELAVGETKYIMARDANESDIGMSLRMTNQLAEIQRRPEMLRKNLADDKSKLNALESRLDTPFQFTKELTAKIKEAADLEAEMTAVQEPVAAPEDVPPGDQPMASTGDTVSNPHTVASLKSALINAHSDSDLFALQAMIDSGKVKIVTNEEAQALRGADWLGSNRKAVFNPKDKTTYFIADNNSKQATPEKLRGLVRHEIAIHAMHLGRDSAEFQSILAQLNLMKQAGNKKVNEAWDSVPETTHPDNVPEEALGYLTENNPELPIIKRVVAWFRNAIRAIGKAIPVTQRLKINEWANKLNDTDLLYMAQTAMREQYHPEISGDDVMFSTAKTTSDTAKTTSDKIPEETNTQAVQRVVQDKMVRFQVIRDWLASQGKVLTEKADVWMNEGNMHGKIAARSEDFRENTVKPLIEKTQKAGFTMGQVAEYLEMKHIPEANARMRQIHNDPDATANGVEDSAAKAVLAQYQQHKDFAKLDAIASEWQAITASTRDILVNAGIISSDMAEAWKATYQNYVPLKGDEEQTGSGTGKGLNVNGKTKRRLGHGDREEAVIQNMLRDHERAIQLEEKNNVGISLVHMAVEAQNPDLITVGKPERRQVYKDKTAFEVQYKGVPVGSFDSMRDAQDFILRDTALAKRQGSSYGIAKSNDPTVVFMASPMLAENEVNVYINGHTVRVQLNDELLAQAYTNMGVEHVGLLFTGAREFNSWLSKAYTGYNPEFALVNLSRDMFAGSINLTGDYGIGMTAKIYANYPRAIKELLKSFSDPAKSKLIADYRAAGGNTGAAYLSDLERIGKDVMGSYNEYAGTLDTLGRTYAENRQEGRGNFVAGAKATGAAISAGYKRIPFIGHFLTLMEHVNAVTENALRVATFDTLRKNGYSDAKAAQAAKMSTVNFNRKGEISNSAGALYLFFNPSVQGIQRATSVLTSSKHKGQARALAGMMTLGAFVIAEAMRGGDDDDKKKWKQTPDYVKDRNIVINLGNDQQATIPLPYEYSLFWSLGNILSDAMHGANGWKLGVRLSDAIMGNFSPIGNPIEGGEATPVQILPTALKMIVAPTLGSEGQDSFGRPLLPKKFSEAKPDSQTMFRSSKGSPYSSIAEGLNSATGGDAYHKGHIDVSPETLKYWVSSLTGGTGKFAIDSITLGSNIAQGVDTVELREMPVVRKFVRESGVSDARQLFYTHSKEAKEKADALMFAKQARDPSGAQKIVGEDLAEIKLAAYAAAYHKQLKAYSDLVDAIRLDDKLTLNEKRLQMKMYEKKEQVVYDAFDQHFTKLMGAKTKP